MSGRNRRESGTQTPRDTSSQPARSRRNSRTPNLTKPSGSRDLEWNNTEVGESVELVLYSSTTDTRQGSDKVGQGGQGGQGVYSNTEETLDPVGAGAVDQVGSSSGFLSYYGAEEEELKDKEEQRSDEEVLKEN